MDVEDQNANNPLQNMLGPSGNDSNIKFLCEEVFISSTPFSLVYGTFHMYYKRFRPLCFWIRWLLVYEHVTDLTVRK